MTSERNPKSTFIIFFLTTVIIILFSCCVLSYLGKGFLSKSLDTYTAGKIKVLPRSSRFMPEGLQQLYIGMKLKDIKDDVKYEGREIFLIKQVAGVDEIKLFVDDIFNNKLYFLQIYKGARIYCFQFKLNSESAYLTYIKNEKGHWYDFMDLDKNSPVRIFKSEIKSDFLVAIYYEENIVEIWETTYFFRSKHLK